VKAFAAFVLTAGCSVPPLSLEGKQCPCTGDYVCDTLTNRCLQSNGDGGILDTPAATGCVAPLTNETELYRYTGMYDWSDQGGTWSGTATEIRQTDKMAQAFAYRTSANLNVANVHVISSMRETAEGNGGTPGLGVVIRTKLDGSARYRCMVQTGKLVIERQDSGGAATIGTPANTGVLPSTFTMEASAVGGTLSCCIREAASARINAAMDATIPMGYPGLEVERKAAAFGSFVVFGSP